jgi:hypothetical protein
VTHPASKSVVRTNLRTGEEHVYASAKDAERDGFTLSCISRCCHSSGRATHGGFAWAFKEQSHELRMVA